LIEGLYTSYAPKDLTEFGWSRESQLTAVCIGDMYDAWNIYAKQGS